MGVRGRILLGLCKWNFQRKTPLFPDFQTKFGNARLIFFGISLTLKAALFIICYRKKLGVLMENNKREPYRFLVMFFFYLAAAAVGVLVAYLLPLPLWLSILIADVAATVFLFLVGLPFKNASVSTAPSK